MEKSPCFRVLLGVCPSVLLGLAAGCAGRLPVMQNEVLHYSRSAPVLTPDHPDYANTLQIRWLGTACYLIQLGDMAILTDPFFSHHGLLETAFGTVESDEASVAAKTVELPKPQAIFIGHSHFDHMLDLAETIRQRGWFDVPTYGSVTTGNILSGYGPDLAEYVRRSFRLADTDGAEHPAGNRPEVTYRAFVSEHAPQVDHVLLYPGEVLIPRTTPPTRAADFPVGETYTFLFTLTEGNSSASPVFTVFFSGAASNPPVGLPSPPAPFTDVAILTVPGWKNVRNYPRGFIRALTPRYLLPSHYDNFFQTGSGQETVVPTANLAGFLDASRSAATHLEFEGILVPAVDAVLHFASR